MGILQDLPNPDLSKKGWPWNKETCTELYDLKTGWPKISIVTPSFNQGIYIEETIRSILLQNYPNLEFIIIDGGSTDDTLQIIQKYEDWITYWVSEHDKGQTHALNKGFKRCTGEIVAYLNSDDYYENETLFKVASYFRDPTVNIINGDCAFFWEGDVKYNLQKATNVTYEGLLKYWKGEVIPAQPSVFFRKSVLEFSGYPDESLFYGMDVDMWLRMSRKYAFTKVNELFSFYRFHKESKTGGPGLFKKFRPEWYKLSQRELKQQNVSFKIKYYLSKYFYDFRVWFYELRIAIFKVTGINIGSVDKDNENNSILSFINKRI